MSLSTGIIQSVLKLAEMNHVYKKDKNIEPRTIDQFLY